MDLGPFAERLGSVVGYAVIVTLSIIAVLLCLTAVIVVLRFISNVLY